MSTTSASPTQKIGFGLPKLNFKWRKPCRPVMQSEASECGLACLTMINQFHGDQRSIDDLRRILPSSQQGLNLKTLLGQASLLNLAARPVKVEMSELSQLRLPAILHWQFKHFVVLTKITATHCQINDPAFGARKLPINQVADVFTGVAIELIPTGEFSPQAPGTRLRLLDFVKHISGIKAQLAMLIALSLLLQVFAILGPFYLQTTVDQVIVRQDHPLLNVLALAFGLVLALELVTQYVRQRAMLWFSHNLNLNMGAKVFTRLLSLPYDYFQKRHMGDIVSRFGSLQHVREVITNGIISGIIDGLMALATLLVMLMYSVKLAFLVVAITALYALLRWALFYPTQRLNQEGIQAQAEENAHFMQSVRAVRTIKLANTEDKRRQDWLGLLVNSLNKHIALDNWNLHFSVANRFLFGIENILVIYIAASLVLDNLMTVGMLFAFVSYKARFVSAIDNLIQQVVQYKMLNVHLDRLADIMHTEPEISAKPPATNAFAITNMSETTAQRNKQTPQSGLVAIELQALSYRYHSAHAPVFSELNLSIYTGTSVAIVGPSGCGKSTLMQCLLGLLSPSHGQVLINGKVLGAHNRHQHGIAAVLQEDQLLNGSILDNICDFSAHPDLQAAVQAAEQACLHDDIMRMTMQYNTLIGDMGDSLSGGQRQRLFLARALYKRPKILLLDEATSHLDSANEQRINAHLRALNTTKIMIAHRQETIASADRVIELSSLGLQDVSHVYLVNTPVPTHQIKENNDEL